MCVCGCVCRQKTRLFAVLHLKNRHEIALYRSASGTHFPTLQNQVPLSALLNTSSDYLTDYYIIILYILFILSYSCMILLILANYAIEYLFATKKKQRAVQYQHSQSQQPASQTQLLLVLRITKLRAVYV